MQHEEQKTCNKVNTFCWHAAIFNNDKICCFDNSKILIQSELPFCPDKNRIEYLKLSKRKRPSIKLVRKH